MADRTAAQLNKGSLYQETFGSQTILSYTDTPGRFLQRQPTTAVESPFSTPPSVDNTSVRISRYLTLGEVINSPCSDRIPYDKQPEVVKNLKNVCYNLLDPIRYRWDILVLAGYRQNSSNHADGLAVDITAPHNLPNVNGAISEYAARYLPCEQVWLERSGTNRLHVHLKLRQIGAIGAAAAVPVDIRTYSDAQQKQYVPYLAIEQLLKDQIR